ncbi:hypothetical protein H2200_012369 [Cladophialophora chaetospira]|uniref:Uncharacterized protein n=1 Tax=Cladophialophora chaetospira TaxID=386627 RepID=A0AA38WXQ7_9EURO|nr:hypothetical protein H2200_012369 [Cladophialophora chaetospira]
MTKVFFASGMRQRPEHRFEGDDSSPMEDNQDWMATAATISQHQQQRPQSSAVQDRPTYRSDRYRAYHRPPTPMPRRYEDEGSSDDNGSDSSTEGPTDDSESASSSSTSDEEEDFDDQGLTFRERADRLHQVIDAALAEAARQNEAHRERMRVHELWVRRLRGRASFKYRRLRVRQRAVPSADDED